jgi:putative hydrolase of the HAD superfamily
VFTSAATGYERPNPRAFEIALEACGWPSESWMVGDNPIADIAGAEPSGSQPYSSETGTTRAERCLH